MAIKIHALMQDADDFDTTVRNAEEQNVRSDALS